MAEQMTAPAGEGKLLARVRGLLNTTDRTYLEIYDQTGLHPNWLSGVANGRTKDPSVNRVEELYEYLSGQKLIGE